MRRFTLHKGDGTFTGNSQDLFYLAMINISTSLIVLTGSGVNFMLGSGHTRFEPTYTKPALFDSEVST